MMLIEETPIPDVDLPVEAFKVHVRQGSGFATDGMQDAVIQSFLRAAIAAVEARTAKALMTRMFTLTRRHWSDPQVQSLPVAPVQTLVSVTLVGSDDEESLVDAGEIKLVQDGLRPVLRSMRSALPAIPRNGHVRIRFEAGMASAWEALPSDLRQAVFLLAGHYYEYRHDTALSDGCMPFGVSTLIERYKTVRIGLGAGQ